MDKEISITTREIPGTLTLTATFHKHGDAQIVFRAEAQERGRKRLIYVDGDQQALIPRGETMIWIAHWVASAARDMDRARLLRRLTNTPA